jgi:hypothetical protein
LLLPAEAETGSRSKPSELGDRMGIISIDDQPISATWFGESRWLTEFITPDAMEIKELFNQLCGDTPDKASCVRACHNWVATQIQYKPFIKARLWVEGRSYTNPDTWLRPSLTRCVGVGNCANKAFLLTSLLRNAMDPGEVHCVLGNLYNGKAGGHAWVQVKIGERAYIVESTRPDVEPMVSAAIADRYEAVHFFNDQTAYAIEGRTVMEPFSDFYSTWLSDYLNWAYIEGRKE